MSGKKAEDPGFKPLGQSLEKFLGIHALIRDALTKHEVLVVDFVAWLVGAGRPHPAVRWCEGRFQRQGWLGKSPASPRWTSLRQRQEDGLLALRQAEDWNPEGLRPQGRTVC